MGMGQQEVELEVEKIKENPKNDKDAEMEKEVDEVRAACEVDPWSHQQPLPCWWLVVVVLLSPVLLPLRLLGLLGLVCSR